MNKRYKKRHFQFSQKSNEVRFRLFGELKFAEEKNEDHIYQANDTVEIQIMRVGKWNHALYGQFQIGISTLKDVIKNFVQNVRGTKLAIDENHEPNHRALAWVKSLILSEDERSIGAKLTLTKAGAKLLTDGSYRYFSPEIIFRKRDEETGKIIKNLLIGGAFTNRPFFKSMTPLMATVADQSADQKTVQNILFYNQTDQMNKFLELVNKFAELDTISKEQATELKNAFAELPAEDQADSSTLALYNDLTEKFNEEKPEEPKDPKPEPEEPEEPKEEEDDDDDDDDDDEDNNDDDEDNITATETTKNGKKFSTIETSELNKIKAIAKLVSKTTRKLREAEFSEKLNSISFSETNQKGTLEILPKCKRKITEFALSLSEPNAEKFFNILQNIKTISTAEIGTSKPGKVETASGINKSEALKFFAEQGMSPKEQETAYNYLKEDEKQKSS